jgi:AcrR family transcriptional regulator
MPGPARETKRRIIDAAYELFYKGGFARVGVDDIAEAAGVTKRTLYYHFDSKDALVAAVLEVQNALMLTRMQRWARRASGNPATVVEKLFAEFAAWARRPGWRGSGFTRAAMEFAHLPGHPARVAARRHKAAVESWLAEELDGNRTGAARQLARQIMLLIEGCHSLILIHGDASYADAAAEAARLLVHRHRTAKPALGPAKRRH